MIKRIITSLSCLLLSSVTFAEPQQIIAPPCLLKNFHASYKTLAASETHVLIEMDSEAIEQLALQKHKQHCGGFKNVSTAFRGQPSAQTFLLKQTLPIAATVKKLPPLYVIKHEAQVNPLLEKINSPNMWADLALLTQFPDRYSRSQYGVETAAWIKNQIETIAKNSGHDDVSVYYVNTGKNYLQPSVVAKIGDSKAAGIVIGGHMDTLSSKYELMPGADDDGTGSVTLLEVARVLLNSHLHFQKPIYLIWYAAEEMGLVGSGYVVSDFHEKNIPVSAVMQVDMTGFMYQNDPAIWLMTDNDDADLRAYLEILITTYVKQPIKFTRCGYACSDHATWHEAGFAAVMPTESAFEHDNPYIHTAKDQMNVLSLNHMTDFAKLAVAFAVELAGVT